MGAFSAGSLPRCRQQVKIMRHKQDEDPVFCHVYVESQGRKGKEPFVRLVNAALSVSFPSAVHLRCLWRIQNGNSVSLNFDQI